MQEFLTHSTLDDDDLSDLAQAERGCILAVKFLMKRAIDEIGEIKVQSQESKAPCSVSLLPTEHFNGLTSSGGSSGDRLGKPSKIQSQMLQEFPDTLTQSSASVQKSTDHTDLKIPVGDVQIHEIREGPPVFDDNEDYRKGVGQFLRDIVAASGKRMLERAEKELRQELTGAKLQRKTADVQRFFRKIAGCTKLQKQLVKLDAVFTQGEQLHEMCAMLEELGEPIITVDFCRLLANTFRDRLDVVQHLIQKCPSLTFPKPDIIAETESDRRFATTCCNCIFVYCYNSALWSWSYSKCPCSYKMI